ncbi:hypothetical protein LPB140_04900 [Sphingorhabdus lutea]|uniref:MFS transporter n=1 Tax=Sphingorhabdus lutea TaxID=1913578 RepID=A0A1L3JAV2_9SPHN|nr:MFS transporter [Sphingorhabdus lutea]APG62248.1 hypothetical protein LPB140_04900 [Sphingorhabdus lutea]
MLTARKLPQSLKLFHGMGAIAYGVKDNGFSVFLLIFYNQVLGIDAGIVGTAIMCALIFDAFIDPFIGEMSDRTQSRWGRRLPWLYLAPIPLGLAWLALWHPPTADQSLQIAWLIGFAILVRSLVAACEVPSISLVPELTADYHERTVLMRYRFLFGWAGGLVLMVFAYAVIFTDAAKLTQREGYSDYAFICASLLIGSVMLSALAQHKYAAIPSPVPSEPAGKLRDIFTEMKKTLSNRPFLILASGAVFAFIGQALQFSLTNYLMIFVWRLDLVSIPLFGMNIAGMAVYGLSLFFSVILAFLMVSPISEKFGKKNAAIIMLCLSLFIFITLYCAWLLDLMPSITKMPNPWLLLLIINIANGCSIVTMILNSSMMTDVVEASQAETGRRSEGLFFAGYFFMQKCAVGIGIFISGSIVSMSNFPEKAVAGKVEQGSLTALVLGYMAATVILGIAYAMRINKFPITKEEHDERLKQLASRNVNDDSISEIVK